MSHLFDLPFEEPPLPDDPTPPVRTVYSVSELSAAIRHVLEDRFVEVWVEGELSNCKTWNTGHVYFTLKDGAAQVKGVMFRSALRYLRFKPEDGLHVIARGRVTVYEPKGEYQLVCEHLEPRGFGALQLAFEQLKKRLHAEGLFDTARKRPLPALPRKIGIVTSLDGAALRDIVKVLSRRYPNAHVVIRPTRVQGEGAAAEVARAIGAIARVTGVDVVIVGRGGGSIDDLWTFNEEIVARAIAACVVPVMSAVGHEVDVTIADFVADVRAPTPSAAAEMVVARKDEYYARIDRLRDRARAATRAHLQRDRAEWQHLAGRSALAGFAGRVALRGGHVAELTHALRHAMRADLGSRARRYRTLRAQLDADNVRSRLAQLQTRLVATRAHLRAAVAKGYHRADARLRSAAGRLDSLSPLAVLSRGYAVCWNADRTAIVRDAATVRAGDGVHVKLQTGELACEVVERAERTIESGPQT